MYLLPQPRRYPGWTANVFNSSDEAQVALFAERSTFLRRHDIMTLIPIHIQRRILYPGDIARIEGFRDLFKLLNTDPDAEELRKRIIDYFEGLPALRGNLS